MYTKQNEIKYVANFPGVGTDYRHVVIKIDQKQFVRLIVLNIFFIYFN